MKTLEIQKRVKEINDKKETELKKLDLEISGTKKTGLQCSAINKNWLKFETENKKDILNILKEFKPIKENSFLRFASQKDIETESAFLLCISNYKHITNDKYLKATLKYKTSKGLIIWIDLSKEIIKFNTQYKQVNENSRARNPEMYAFFTLNNKTGLKCQSYYGGSLTYHGSKERFLELFK
jgi:hypothetical protein